MTPTTTRRPATHGAAARSQRWAAHGLFPLSRNEQGSIVVYIVRWRRAGACGDDDDKDTDEAAEPAVLVLVSELVDFAANKPLLMSAHSSAWVLPGSSRENPVAMSSRVLLSISAAPTL